MRRHSGTVALVAVGFVVTMAVLLVLLWALGPTLDLWLRTPVAY